MHLIDWIIMLGTLFGIVAYGVWKTRNISSVKSYLLGDRDLPWWTIGLSIMATQASAITFLSTPGQAYYSGMGFAQFYIGLPVAMVILCIFFLPIYYKLKVYTAYEFLESRFDLKTRLATAVLFLVARGLAAGLTIYAPAIILSTILDWNLAWTILFIGVIVIFYTVLGGTKAVSVTQKQQMIVILSGMFIAGVIILFQFPADVGFNDAVSIAGKLDKLEVISFEFDLSDRYNFWSGMLGGVFLFLSYFGTDQSQVQRYLSGKSLTESRLGLLFNGIFKVPMQFSILFVGILVFVFFLFVKPPVHFNDGNVKALSGTPSEAVYQNLNQEYDQIFEQKQVAVEDLRAAINNNNEQAITDAKSTYNRLHDREAEIRTAVKDLIIKEVPTAKTEDKDYVFITFVMNYLPIGLVGLLLAVIFSAAMSSTASELNALATTTVIDVYKRILATDKKDKHYLAISKGMTILWGGFALIFAFTADLFENLIQAVNIIGSLVYGTILGIFMVAFFMKKIRSNAVFAGAILGELTVITIALLNNMDITNISFLWWNPIGCLAVMGFSWLYQQIFE